MFRNYLKQAYRNLFKNKFQTLTNIIGLGFGFAIVILIFLYISHETSYNKSFENSERIYRLAYRYVEANGNVGYAGFLPDNLPEIFHNDIPQIEYLSPFRHTRAMIGHDNKKYYLNLGFGEQEFFNIFSMKFIAGTPGGAMDDPNDLVITKSTADKIFGTNGQNYDKLIGKALELPRKMDNLYNITGVIEDLPDNSTFKFDLMASWKTASSYPRSNNSFGANIVYIQLFDESQKALVEEVANSLIDKNWGEQIEGAVKFGILQDSEDNFRFHLENLERTYLHYTETSVGGYARYGNLKSIYIMASIGILILIIACINYIMLNIGQSINRMKSLGMMNIIGAQKSQISKLFITESAIVTLFALFIGIVLAEQLLPLFNRLAQKNLEFTIYQDWQNIIYLITIVLIIVLVTSSWVTFSLYRNKHPLYFVRGELKLIRKSGSARAFVMLQYIITITLMIAGLMIVKQLNYLREKPVGFNDENVVVILVDFEYNSIQLLKEKFLQHPDVLNVTSGDRNFTSGSSSQGLKNERGELVDTRMLRIDERYVNTLDLTILEGRNFIEGNQSDWKDGIIVNETFVDQFGIKDPVGHIIMNNQDTMRIVGVVKNFHFDSMKENIDPLILHLFPWNSIWYVFVKISPDDMSETLARLQKDWNEIAPEYTFEYTFLEDMLDEQYNDEERWSKITMIAAFIAIFLSCLGLLGISSLMVSKRVKEIGIRKVNGAKIADILLLLYTDILKWVGLAFLISIPLGWYAINRWLQNFAYRTDISWWVFIVAGLIAIIISVITISWQSLRASKINPVDCLRYE
ncbi:MAG: ABC transporter permease [Bacteroidales bacterium]